LELEYWLRPVLNISTFAHRTFAKIAAGASAFAMLLFLIPSPSHAQETPLDSVTLQEQVDALRQKTGLIGVGVTVMVDGKIIAAAASGERKKGSGVAVTVDDKWHHGSITKSMTATVIAKLVERGSLAWDTPLPDLLPEMAADMDAGWKEVTLHHILSHSAGLPANFPLRVMSLWPEDAEALREARREELAKVLAKPPKSVAGEAFVYSNVGYTLAGFIAAENAETNWESLMEQELFAPLKLDSAGFGPPQGAGEIDQPWGHRVQLLWKVPVDKHADNTPVIGPAGIVQMSMADLATYGWEHLRGERGHSTLLKSDTFQRLHTAVISDYGYGWVCEKNKWGEDRVFWHNGSNTLWYSLLALVPSKNAVLVLVCNDGKISTADPAFVELAETITGTLSRVGSE